MIYSCFFGVKKRKFGAIGNNVIFTPPLYADKASNVLIGDNVSIGACAYISTTKAKLIIKGNCAIAEHLTVHTGNHARIVGKFVTDVTNVLKPKDYDRDIVIEEDVWIGCNVTILSGVHVGRGSTIAAGAVVNKDVPPSCVAGGVPTRVIKFYWCVDQIMEHEKVIYPENKRMSRSELETIIRKLKG